MNHMGLVQATLEELLNLGMQHFFSAVDMELFDLPIHQRCGTVTVLSGYTEWMASAEHLMTIGWDWCVLAKEHGMAWQRDELPRTNIQLLNQYGQAIVWEDNLRILAAWIDSHIWQNEVVRAVSVDNN
jgi:hypothetical protein